MLTIYFFFSCTKESRGHCTTFPYTRNIKRNVRRKLMKFSVTKRNWNGRVKIAIKYINRGCIINDQKAITRSA